MIVPFSPNEEAQIKREFFLYLRTIRAGEVLQETHRAEREAATNFRNQLEAKSLENERDSKIDDMSRSISRLKTLLELRDKVCREIRLGLKTASDLTNNFIPETIANESRRSRTTAVTMTRYRGALSRRRSDNAVAQEEAVQRLIDVEKAKQMSEQFTPTEPVHNPSVILNRLDETKKVIKREKLRHSEKRVRSHVPPPRKLVLLDSKPKQPMRPCIKYPKTSPSLSTTQPSSTDLGALRRSIDVLRRRDFPVESSHDENVLVAERRNGLEQKQHTRAALAALKLKH